MNKNQFISNDDGNNDKQFGIKKDKLPDFIKKSSQPKIALITVSIKLLALFFFLFLNIFTSNEDQL